MEELLKYLRQDVGQPGLNSWEEIRLAYAKRALDLVGANWQSPSFVSSGQSQAGSREGKIYANINDYTRDHHNLAGLYEGRFARAYLPWHGLLGLSPYIFSSGMAALATVIAAIHRSYGAEFTVWMGEHSYYQNKELIKGQFSRVVEWNEMDEQDTTRRLMLEQPRVILVDTLCNESELSVPPILNLVQQLKHSKREVVLVVDNSLLGIGFPWQKLVRQANSRVEIVGWESLNKYYQFGLDRTTGGVAWGTGRVGRELFQARMHAGTVMTEMSVAMLPTPNKRIMQKYLARIEQNRRRWQTILGRKVRTARGDYEFLGAQLVVAGSEKWSYPRKLQWIRRVIAQAKRAKLTLVGGTSFGMPNTRLYVTKKDNRGTKAFLRISVGTEESGETTRQAELVRGYLG